jgi:hypothetical protein
VRRDQGCKQVENAKTNAKSIQEGGQHEPSSYNNYVVHDFVNKTSHKTLQLEGIKMFKYL